MTENDFLGEGPAPLIGEIRAFASESAPPNWLPCDGRLLAISKYRPLYSILGNQYGGSAPDTFALPNLQGRTIVGSDDGPLTPGTKLGKTSYQFNEQNMPRHTHPMVASTQAGSLIPPELNGLADSIDMGPDNDGSFYGTPANGALPSMTLHPNTLELTGDPEPEPFTNMQPYSVLNFFICWGGLLAQQK